MIESTAVAFSVTLLVVVFAIAGVSKLRALDTFVGVVHNFRLLPEALVRPVAYALPFLEVAVAVGLLLPITRDFAAWGTAVLLAIFTLAVAINLIRGRREIDCGCFSSELAQNISGWLVLRNMVLASLALWLAAGTADIRSSAYAAWLMGMATALVVAVIYAAITTLAALSRRTTAHHPIAEQHH